MRPGSGRLRRGPSLVLVLCASTLLAASSPDERAVTDPMAVTSASNPAAQAVPIHKLYYTRTVGGASWSPDGKQVVFSTNLTGRMNLWKVAASGGWPIQLSESDDRQSGAVWSPDGKWIVFEQDAGGGEIFDLYAVPADGGDAVNLTNTLDVSETGARWSPDGGTLAISYRPKDSSSEDIALLDWKSRQVRKLTNEQAKDREWGEAVWSPDGKTIYADRANAGFTDSDVYRIDVATGGIQNLTPHKGEVMYSVSSVSPDGSTLLVTSNAKGGYQNVALLDVATKAFTWVTSLQWDTQAGHFSPDGATFTYSVNEDGRTDVYLVSPGDSRFREAPSPARHQRGRRNTHDVLLRWQEPSRGASELHGTRRLLGLRPREPADPAAELLGRGGSEPVPASRIPAGPLPLVRRKDHQRLSVDALQPEA